VHKHLTRDTLPSLCPQPKAATEATAECQLLLQMGAALPSCKAELPSMGLLKWEGRPWFH